MRAGERHRVYTDEGVLGGGGPLEPIQHSGPASSTAYREQPSDWILRLDQQQRCADVAG